MDIKRQQKNLNEFKSPENKQNQLKGWQDSQVFNRR